MLSSYSTRPQPKQGLLVAQRTRLLAEVLLVGEGSDWAFISPSTQVYTENDGGVLHFRANKRTKCTGPGREVFGTFWET